MAYNDGDIVDLVGPFTDPTNNNAPVDPTKVAVSYRINAGAWTDAQYGFSSLVRDSQGNYHLALDLTGLGGDTVTYFYQSKGTAQKHGDLVTFPVNSVLHNVTFV